MPDATDWYNRLEKPFWAPPASAFGAVWGLLYPIIISVNVWVIVLLARRTISWRIAAPFWINLVANLLFVPIQFGLRNNTLALVDVVVVLATIVWAISVIWPYNRVLGIAYVPYLLWVAFATALQASITWLNR
jgi:translocator protein